MSNAQELSRRDALKMSGVAALGAIGAGVWGACMPSQAQAEEAANIPEGAQVIPVDCEGTASAYTITNYITKMDVTSDAAGIVTDIQVDEASMPFAWGRMVVTEEEKANPPEDLLLADVVVWGGITGFSKYISIGGVLFEGTLREQDDPVLAHDFKQVVKYTAVDGSIDDLYTWLYADDRNCRWYFEALADRDVFNANADGTPSDREAAPSSVVMEGKPNAGEIGFLKSEIDTTLEPFDWLGNVDAFCQMAVGTNLPLTLDQITRVEGEDGRTYWAFADTVSGATFCNNRVYYMLAKKAYQNLLTAKTWDTDQQFALGGAPRD